MPPALYPPARPSKASYAELQGLLDTRMGTGELERLGMAKPPHGAPLRSSNCALATVFGANVKPRALMRKDKNWPRFTRRSRLALDKQMKNFIAKTLLACSRWLAALALTIRGK